VDAISDKVKTRGLKRQRGPFENPLEKSDRLYRKSPEGLPGGDSEKIKNQRERSGKVKTGGISSDLACLEGSKFVGSNQGLSTQTAKDRRLPSHEIYFLFTCRGVQGRLDSAEHSGGSKEMAGGIKNFLSNLSTKNKTRRPVRLCHFICSSESADPSLCPKARNTRGEFPIQSFSCLESLGKTLPR